MMLIRSAQGGREDQMVARRAHVSMSKSLEPVNVTSLGKRVCAGTFKDLNMRSSWVTPMGPESGDKCPIRDRIRKEKRKSRRQCVWRRGRHWHDVVKECQGPPGATRSWERRIMVSPLEPPGGVWPCQHPDSGLLAPRTVRD